MGEVRAEAQVIMHFHSYLPNNVCSLFCLAKSSSLGHTAFTHCCTVVIPRYCLLHSAKRVSSESQKLNV